MMKRSEPIYLDNNATTAMDPAVVESMRPYLEGLAGNASSRHSIGRRARRAIDESQQSIARSLGCRPDEIVFTSGATEANNLAIRALAGPIGSHILVNATEHPSALEPCRYLRSLGYDVEEIPVDSRGVIREPVNYLRDETTLVVIQFANSETGVLQDIPEIRSTLPANCRLHVDATQAVGKVPVDFRRLGVSSLAMSGHKIHGPSGVGCLLTASDIFMSPIFMGGEQQRGIRPGTEPVAAIAGLGRAVELATEQLASQVESMRRRRDGFEQQVLARIPDVVSNANVENRLPNTCNLSFLGTRLEALLMALDLAGLCASAGTACASGSLEPSPVLQVMAVPEERLLTAVRFSVSRFTTDAELEEAVQILARVVPQVRSRISSRIHPS